MLSWFLDELLHRDVKYRMKWFLKQSKVCDGKRCNKT